MEKPQITLDTVKKTTRCVECEKPFKLTESQRQHILEEVQWELAQDRVYPRSAAQLQREMRFGCPECLSEAASYGPFRLL